MNKTTTFYTVIGITLFILVLLKYYGLGFGSGFEGFQAGVDTFTLYYAEWCPHCKDVKPIFQSWGADKGSVQIGGKTVFVKLIEEQQLKADDPNKTLVKGYPTFILNRAGNAQGIEFDGDRSPEGWAKWISSKI